jgi:hypothetical protein
VVVRAPLRERAWNAENSLSPGSGYRSIPAKLDGSPVECSIQNLRAELNASQKEEERLREGGRQKMQEFASSYHDVSGPGRAAQHSQATPEYFIGSDTHGSPRCSPMEEFFIGSDTQGSPRLSPRLQPRVRVLPPQKFAPPARESSRGTFCRSSLDLSGAIHRASRRADNVDRLLNQWTAEDNRRSRDLGPEQAASRKPGLPPEARGGRVLSQPRGLGAASSGSSVRPTQRARSAARKPCASFAFLKSFAFVRASLHE